MRLDDRTGLGLADHVRAEHRSTYTVGVGSGEELIATVWNTGSWTSTSPWLPLGRTEVPPGPTTVSVRARDLAGLATWPGSRS